jgi:hypothetical protein
VDRTDTRSTFQTKLLRPAKSSPDGPRAFVVLPKAASEKLPRRGRTTVLGTFADQPFQATLEPDGKLSHWLPIDDALLEAAKAAPGDTVTIVLASVEEEPEPELPRDLERALAASPDALAVWKATTTVARLDWIHWITTAKQAKTRAKRIGDACDMLASGKKRVCCFDPSGFYSKALSAPKAAE